MRRELSTTRCEGAEVRSLRATLFGSLPLAVTLCCRVDSAPVLCAVTGSRAVWKALKRSKRVVFGTIEWAALVSAFGSERASPYDFVGWCELKRRNPHWRINERDAFGQLPREQRAHDVQSTVGEVLDGWGLLLIRVSYGDEVPA